MASTTRPSRTVVITGVSPLYALSEETARSFASDNATTHLALLGSAEDYLQKIQSGLSSQFPHVTVFAHRVDITSSESVGIASHNVRAALGAWNVLVHNGSAHAMRCPDTTIRGADEDLWWGSFERNVRSLHFVARHFFSKARGGATFINIVRTDVDGGGVERDSAGCASGVAAAKVVEYLGEENENLGIKVATVVALPEDRQVADFIAWSATQRSAFAHAMSLDASIGVQGYEVVGGKLSRRFVPEDASSEHRRPDDVSLEHRGPENGRIENGTSHDRDSNSDHLMPDGIARSLG
ncbi:hypothetical protein LTR70_002136 [Exophiala xenobiotica]|nr:hypothetical protein LTR70_002136 [Exophiala xenobiotica]